MNKINPEAYQIVWKEFFIMGCNYKYICSKTNITFFQFKNVCKKLACYNYSLIDNQFLKDFKEKEGVDLLNTVRLSKKNRKKYQFFMFENNFEIVKNKLIIFEKFNQVLKMERKLIEDIKQKIKEGNISEKEIAKKYYVSEYFVFNIKHNNTKKIIKKIKTVKNKNIHDFLNCWFEGRIITPVIKTELKKLGILDLVQAGKIKEAKQKIQLI